MPLIRLPHVTRAYVREHPDTIFVFGDNMARTGFGGQAAAMRGEPNVIGVPTKWRPERGDTDYFSDKNWYPGSNVWARVTLAFRHIEMALEGAKTVVIPTDGLGTGLAQLPFRAPLINAYITGRIAELTERFGAKQ